MAAPLETTELTQIVNTTLEKVLAAHEQYDHSSVAGWNTEIINGILQELITRTSAASESKTPGYKFIVNTTIIQHIGSPSEAATAGRRGMHSAVGAYWNNEKDGTWSQKWEGAEKKGMDIVISITWIGL